MVGTLEYNTDLFDAATIRRMVSHFETLLGAIARNPERPIADLALATEAEQALLEAWTPPLEPFDDAICVHELFARQAARTPDAIAVTQRTRDGSQRELSYGELDRRANQLARYLHGLGIGPESRVGLLVERSPEMIVGILAILKAGGAYVPLDPALPTERLAFMLEDAQIAVLLTQSHLTAQIEHLDRPAIVLLDDWSPLAEISSEPLPVAVHATNLAYVIYTSGSTGRPKGVLTTHQSVVSYLEAVQPLYRLSATDRVLQFASLSFDASAEEIYGSLTTGAALVLRTDEMLASAGIFFAACRDWQLSVLSLPTAYWHELCAQLAGDPVALPSDLRLMIIGGERAQSARLAQWQQIAPQVQLLNTYGPTEATIVATAWEAEQPADTLRELPIGRPLRNVQGYILDAQLRRVPLGVPGELCLSGPALARGYLARPDVTAERFIPNPFASHPGARLYRTGDLARYLPDGTIEFLGRIDDQVKLRGFRIEPGEIEAALLEHEAVRESAVVVRDDQLVAYVVGEQKNKRTKEQGNKEQTENQEPRTKNLEPNFPPLLSQPTGTLWVQPAEVWGMGSGGEGLFTSESLSSILRTFLSSRLPSYMLPSAFVLLDALPLTASGKLDRRALPAPARQTAPDRAYAPPTTPLEQTIAAIWQQVLHIEQASIHDNFFDLGGHSLRLLQVQNQIRTQLEREVLLPELFRRPTIHELARYLVETALDAGEIASPLPPITRQPRTTNQFPLSFAQQRLWFLDQLQMDDSSYNIPLALRLTGRLDLAALERCYQTIVARHEVLRTTFAIPRAGAEPVQVIHLFQSQPLPLHDLGTLPAPEREAEALRHTVAEASQPFDLAAGPLVRAQLLRLAPTEHLLLVTLHHTIADGWSLGVLVQELVALYTADPTVDPLPELPIQYADYAVWQRDWMEGAIYHQQLDYWRQQLAPREDSLPLLQLPTDRPHPSIYTTHGASLRRALPQPLADALRDLSALHGATLFMTLLAGFYTLLYRYTGQTDLVVGSPIAGRRQAESERLIGFFVNTLALRTQLQGELRFGELLRRVHETALGAYAHQDLPFELLVEELRIERITNRTPIFQVLFVLQNTPLPVLALPDLTIRPVEAANNTAKFDLTVQIFEDNGALLGDFEYNTDIFEAATIERLIDHWQTLLASIVAAPAQRLDDLALLPPAEQHLLLHDWNTTAAPYPADALVHHGFERQVERTPDAEAALMIDGDRVVAALSYAELNARANQLAHYLRDLGVGPDQPVGLFLPRSLDLLIAVLAILKAGGAYLPLDPTYPAERLQFMLANAGAPVVLTHAALRERIQPVDATSSARIVCLDHEQARIDQQPQHNLVDTASPENLTYVIYTSGSTGQPKGVAMPHRALVNLMTWQLEKTVLREPVRTLQFAPISFDASFQELFTAWGCGDAIVMLPDEQRRDTPVLLEILRAHRIGRLFLPFVALQQIAETAITLDLIPDSLREIMTAGEQLQTTRSLVALFQRLPHCTLHNQYGPSEAHVVTHYTLSAQPATWAALPPIGRPIANTQLYLLDRQLRPVPLGVVGDLYLGGDNLARGYQQRPDLTAERFVPDPFGAKAGSRLYATGDLARYLPDGNVEFLGRRDAQLKIRGYRIELGEIEAVLGQHPDVQAAVVVPHRRVLPDGLTHDTRLVAYVVPQAEQRNKRTSEPANQEPRPKNQGAETSPSPVATAGALWAKAWRGSGKGGEGHNLTPDDLLAFLQQRLPDYLVPSACLLLDALPRTPSGKVDRKALPDPEAAFQSSASYVPPSTPEELSVAALWAELLGLEQVGIHDNFFSLGGHSLLATRLLARLRVVEQIDLPLRALFETPTVAGLAHQIVTLRESLATTAEAVIPRQPRTTNQFPLSFAQQRLWFLDQLDPGDASYNIPLALRLTGQLDVVALERCYQAIVARHESLRTTFLVPTPGAEPVQAIHPFQPLPLPLHDLGALPATEREAEALRRTVAEASQPFDLAAGPLIRAQLLRLEPEEHLLLVTLHHTIADGWSLGVLVQELVTLYTAAPGSDPLPELPIQYADYTVWQRDWMSGDIYQQQLDYWRQQLGGELAPLNLPTDRPRPAQQTLHGATVRHVLPQPLVEELRTLSTSADATLFMTLLAGFYTLLYRYTGQTDLIVGSPIANRTRRESESLIGFFVNTLALRTHVQGELRFGELLERVREVTLGAYAHQDLPFELLVEELRVERDASRSPVFQVLFVLQNTPLPVLALPDLTIHPVEAANNTAKFDLTIHLIEEHGGLTSIFEYNTDLFDTATIERMTEHWQTLLSSIVAAPAQRLDDLALLPPAEQRLLLHDWNATVAPYPADALVHHCFERQAERTPEVIAALFVADDSPVSEISYAELNARANQLAHYLRDRGVGPHQAIGLCLPRSLDLVVGLLAILKAGAAYLPLDPAYPAERLQFMLANAGAPVVLTHAALRERIQPADSGGRTQIICLDRAHESIDQQPQDTPRCTATAEDLAYLIYTSGSTGQPKGVAMPHRALVNLMTWQLEKTVLREPVRTLQFAPISFDVSCQELFTTWGSGGTLVLISEEQRRDPAALLPILREHEVARLFLPFVALQQLAETAIALDLIPDSLREIMTAGEQLQISSAVAAFFELLPECALHNQYGPSETHVVTHYTLSAQPATWAALPPIGRPIANTQLYLLDRQLRPVPLGVVGDLYLGGANLARGYQQRPDLTAERFVPDPFGGSGSRLYKTGDLARYLPDGQVQFVGRSDAQLKIRGFRVELGEIEAVLGQHPDVQAAVVVPHRRVLPDGLTHDTRLVAYVVAQPGQPLTPDDLLAFLQQRLPDYLVPSACLLLDTLPRTPSGKVDRRALPAPEEAFQTTEHYVAPRTPEEETIASLCAELLGLEQVGIHDNFFSLGGHSLLATRLLARLRVAEQIDLPLRALFETPTVAGLAHQIVTLRRALAQAQEISSPLADDEIEGEL
ncbi:MAG TPA: amino acid adenylation domain-containing protein [Herpetosiphonaceae bacterium]